MHARQQPLLLPALAAAAVTTPNEESAGQQAATCCAALASFGVRLPAGRVFYPPLTSSGAQRQVNPPMQYAKGQGKAYSTLRTFLDDDGLVIADSQTPAICYIYILSRLKRFSSSREEASIGPSPFRSSRATNFLVGQGRTQHQATNHVDGSEGEEVRGDQPAGPEAAAAEPAGGRVAAPAVQETPRERRR